MSKKPYIPPELTRYESVEDLPVSVRQVVEEIVSTSAETKEIVIRGQSEEPT